MTPLYLSLVFFAPSLTQNIRSGMKLYGVDLHRQDLTDIVLRGADLRKANLHKAKLQGADLQGANLQGADLQEANLQGANLHGANLRGTKLCGADLSDAILSGVTWEGADLREADVSAATLEVSTLIPVPATPAQNVRPLRPLASSTAALLSRTEGTGGADTLTKATVSKMSREQLTMAYYVGKPPDLQPVEVKDDMPVVLAKMRENGAKRKQRINQENICKTPLAAVVKADTNLLNHWVAYARTLFDKPDGVAKDMLDAAVKLEGNHFGAVFQLGRWWYLQEGKPKDNGKYDAASQAEPPLDRAITLYRQAIDIAKNAKADGTPWKDLEADAHYNLGSAYMLKKEYDEAIEHLTTWQELSNIADDRVLTNLGISYLNSKVKQDKNRARALFKQAADMNPTNDVAKKELRQFK